MERNRQYRRNVLLSSLLGHTLMDFTGDRLKDYNVLL